MDFISIYILICFFVIGMVFGSFINVCVYRIPNHESISFPPSHCPNCDHKLGVKDLIPVFSYLFLHGKCRYCKKPISKQYPIVELLVGVIFAIIFIFFGLSEKTLLLCVISLFLIPIAIIDIKYYIIPNKILIGLTPFAVAIACFHIFVQPVFLYRSQSVMDPIYGALVGGGTLLIFSLLGYFTHGRKEVMGMGDIKLLFVLGLLVGFSNTVLLLFLSVVSAAIGSIIMIAFFKKTAKDMLAFGPYIIGSFYLTVFVGNLIINGYTNLFI
ncbi:MAG: prepilin peptidase [Erysipelotrichaceae bacterium]